MVKKLSIKENVSKRPVYQVAYGGTWNHGVRIFYSEHELRNFLKSNIFDSNVTIQYIVDETDKYDDITTVVSSRDGLTDKGSDEIFHKGITSRDNVLEK